MGPKLFSAKLSGVTASFQAFESLLNLNVGNMNRHVLVV